MTAWGIQIDDGNARVDAGSTQALRPSREPADGHGPVHRRGVGRRPRHRPGRGPRASSPTRATRGVAQLRRSARRSTTTTSATAACLEAISGNGTPALETYDADQDLQDALQHVVITYDPFRGRRIYVDGDWTDDVDEQRPGPALELGPQPRLRRSATRSSTTTASGRARSAWSRSTTGAHRRADPQNFDAGVGKRLLLRFDVSRGPAPAARSSSGHRVRQRQLHVLRADLPHADPGEDYRLAHVRIAVNGVLAPTGQGFVTLDTPVVGARQSSCRARAR